MLPNSISDTLSLSTAVGSRASVGGILAEEVNLKASWGKFWGDFSQAVGTQLLGMITMVGMLLVVGSVLKWLWDRRRGNGGGMGGANTVMWTLLLGATLAAPGLLIPLFLQLLDGIANAFVSIIQP